MLYAVCSMQLYCQGAVETVRVRETGYKIGNPLRSHKIHSQLLNDSIHIYSSITYSTQTPSSLSETIPLKRPRMKLEISLHASKLKNVAGAFKGTSDPFAVVTHIATTPGAAPAVLGKTEV